MRSQTSSFIYSQDNITLHLVSVYFLCDLEKQTRNAQRRTEKKSTSQGFHNLLKLSGCGKNAGGCPQCRNIFTKD